MDRDPPVTTAHPPLPCLAEILPRLQWHRCELQLAPQRHIGRASHALVVLNALLKSVKVGTDPQPDLPRVKRTFRVPHRSAHRLYLPAGKPFTLQVSFFGATDADIDRWLQDFGHHLQSQPQAGFSLLGPPQVTRCHGQDLLPWTQATPDNAELELLSPMPFQRRPGSPRTGLDVEQLGQLLVRRLKSLFGLQARPPDSRKVRLTTAYWHYFEIHHASKSQPGSTQYYNGCVGSLYLRGELDSWLPWLQLAQVLHVSGSVALNPLGYMRLHCPARPRLDKQLLDTATWVTRIHELQQDSDDWLDQMQEQFGAPLDAQLTATRVLTQIASPHWQPGPSQGFTVPKRSGIRKLEKLLPTERLTHAVLHSILNDPIDRQLAPAAYGFRRGRSTQTALRQVHELLQKGYRYAVESDIEDFFPSVDLDRLMQELDQLLPPADTLTRQLLHKLLRAPCQEGPRLTPRHKGLAQGSPLSPLLANLYLDRFDHHLSQSSGQLVRYADDFIILTRTRQEAEQLLQTAQTELAQVGLNLGMDKTAIVDIEHGFRFLGHPFGGQASDPALEVFAVPSRKSVYITEPGAWLGHNGDALEIRQQGQPIVTLPFRRISDIILLEPASLSTQLMRKCAQHEVPLVVTLGSGYQVATVAADNRRSFGIAEQQALHYARLSATERLIYAKAFASQKIANYKPLLRARYERGTHELLVQFDDILEAIENAPGVTEVRGHEGRAARLMFQRLNSFIQVPEFRFEKRLRDQPDRMNALFNFGYYLLFSRLNTLMRAAGLNPYLGFLHDGNDNYETLTCDVQELFRSAVDRLLVSVVNLKIIAPDDFRTTEQGLRLQGPATRRLVTRFEQMLHADLAGITLLRAMEAQVSALRKHLTEGQGMWYFQYPDSTRANTRTTPPSDNLPGAHPLAAETEPDPLD